MKKQLAKKKDNTPKKPPTVVEMAIRNFIIHLKEDGKIVRYADLSTELGFKTPKQIQDVAAGRRHYPKKMQEKAIQLFSTKYKASKDYLQKGVYPMYEGAEYELHEEVLSVVNEDTSNIFNSYRQFEHKNLKKENARLEYLIAKLEEENVIKNNIIKSLNKTIENITKK